ncbi:receptor-like protein kinase FERONIA [Apium graveolens]|uniref:receptor-like protein kinase FERONIA n=1 Tax=Apium graveolens TaxID=4045 RepID=UPI003D79B730
MKNIFRMMVCFSLYIIFMLPCLVVMSDMYVEPDAARFLLASPAYSPSMSPAYTPTSPASPEDTPTDNILINCGAPNKDASEDGREWDIDSLPKFTSSPDILDTSTETFRAVDQSSSVDEIPYSTVRVIRSKLTYTIPVSEAGQKFVRLYFYPTNYSTGFDSTTSFFSVHAADHVLLSNFSAFLNLQPPSLTLVKEYVITVNQSGLLEVTFTPYPNSSAFVNGIEVVSIPDKLYIKENGDSRYAIRMVGRDSQETTSFYVNDSMALEKLYRLNVGGKYISSTDDSGMFRSWDIDMPYLLENDTGVIPVIQIPVKYTLTTPSYTAPEDVYTTARTMGKTEYISNMTWMFQVDSGFNYLLRLHFCEIRMQVNNLGQLVFDIFINNQIAQQAAEILEWTGGTQIPIYKDYAVFVSAKEDGSKSKPYLLLTLRPNVQLKPQYYSTILNGLEIFKLSQPGGSLAAPKSEIEIQNSGFSHSVLVGALLGGLLLFLLMVGFLLLRRRRKKSRDVNNKFRSTSTDNSLLPPVRSHKFSVEEIKLATSNFDNNFVIGKGGFGNVYKGYMKKGTSHVAIKRLNPSSRQGAHEFQTEIAILSNLRHRHLVPLIGCCDDNGEMILVYDYMVHGTLRGHLYGGNNPSLSWKQRLQICIGAARGLHYLHAGAERVIIHRDVKSTNILLDEKMVAKVSDFGLSKMGPSDTSVTHMSTAVKGSFGYLDPEYYLRRQLTTKSDVYSFGVVLFEVLCARPVIMQDLPHERMNLAEWSRICYRKGNLSEIVDTNLTGEIAVESLNKFGEVGYSCLTDHGADRPTMSDVVSSLELALQLQESLQTVDQDNLLIIKCVAEARSGEASSSSTNSDGFKSGVGSVFSDILNPNAR